MPYANHKTQLCMGKKNANSPLPCKIPCRNGMNPERLGPKKNWLNHFPPFPLWVLKALGCFLLHLRKQKRGDFVKCLKVQKRGSCNFFLTPFSDYHTLNFPVYFTTCYHILWLKIHVCPFLKAKKKQNTAFHWKKARTFHSRETNPRAWASGYPKNSHIWNRHFWYLC